MAITESNARYRARKKAAHRAWLSSVKQRCARCGETRPHMLTIVDAATGKGAGLGASGWGILDEQRDQIFSTCQILCQACGHHARRARVREMQEDDERPPDGADG